MTSTTTTAAIAPLPFHSLDDQPRQHFAEFERQVYDDAGSSCLDIFPHGLLFLEVSDPLWANLPDNTVLVEGVPNILPRNTLLQPVQPADNATAGAWKAFERRVKVFDIFSSASALLLKRLKISLPIADRNMLNHPVLGLVNFTTLQIMDHLRSQYGIFRATDFANLTSELETKMLPTSSFDDVSSRQKLIFAQFAEHGQPISELRKCQYLTTSIQHIPHLSKARDLYFQHQPEPSLQTFSQLVAHITVHAPNIVSTIADLGFAGAATEISDHVTRFFQSPQLATILANAITTRSKPTAIAPQSSVPAPTATRKYCYLHGYDWHHSSKCRKMSADKITFCADAKNAADHTAVLGGSLIKL